MSILKYWLIGIQTLYHTFFMCRNSPEKKKLIVSFSLHIKLLQRLIIIWLLLALQKIVCSISISPFLALLCNPKILINRNNVSLFHCIIRYICKSTVVSKLLFFRMWNLSSEISLSIRIFCKVKKISREMQGLVVITTTLKN